MCGFINGAQWFNVYIFRFSSDAALIGQDFAVCRHLFSSYGMPEDFDLVKSAQRQRIAAVILVMVG